MLLRTPALPGALLDLQGLAAAKGGMGVPIRVETHDGAAVAVTDRLVLGSISRTKQEASPG